METAQYLRAVVRSWYLVVVAVLAGGGGGWYVYHHATPLYRTSVKMVVSGAGGTSVDEVTARVLAAQRAQALAQVAPTPPAVDAAKRAAGYPADSPGVAAVAQTESPFIIVTVSDASAQRAQAIANNFAPTLPGVLENLEGVRTNLRLSNLAAPGLPTAPYSPKIKKDVGLGLAVGLVLGVFIALLRGVFNRTVRDSDELERLTGLTVLGTVPRDMPKKVLPAVSDPRSARAEAYRQVRTTLLNVRQRDLRTLAVTSAALGEGKTSVATNLAAVFSRAGHSVALVDADLRRPKVAAFYNLRSQFGLTEVLAGVVPLHQALNVLDGGRLAVLTSGRIPANPSEALGSVGMEQVLEQLSDEYEFVIVDTPPVLPVTDASVLAPKVDGVVLVTRIGHTTRERVRRALAALERVNATVLGVVPNQAGKGADRDYRYPYKYTPSRRKDSTERETVATEHLMDELPEQAPVQQQAPLPQHHQTPPEPPTSPNGIPQYGVLQPEPVRDRGTGPAHGARRGSGRRG